MLSVLLWQQTNQSHSVSVTQPVWRLNVSGNVPRSDETVFTDSADRTHSLFFFFLLRRAGSQTNDAKVAQRSLARPREAAAARRRRLLLL